MFNWRKKSKKSKKKEDNFKAEQSMKELAQLIDCPEEDFKEYIYKCSKGYLMGLHNLLTITYNRTKDTKDDLVKKISSGKLPDSANATLQGLYSELLKIEQRVFILREYLKKEHNVDMH